MKSSVLLLICFLSNLSFLFAQQYPLPVLPGKSITFEAGTDTMWVLKNNQVKKALMVGKELNIVNKQIDVLKKNIEAQIKKEKLNDSIKIILEKEVKLYQTNWETAKKDVLNLNDSNKRCKQIRNIGMIASLVVGFLVGFFIK